MARSGANAIFLTSRMKRTVLANSSAFMDRSYRDRFGTKLWPIIRNALQLPESKCWLHNIFEGTTSHWDLPNKNFFERIKVSEANLKGIARGSSESTSVSSIESGSESDIICCLDHECTRFGEDYDENIFFDMDAYERATSQSGSDKSPSHNWSALSMDPEVAFSIRTRFAVVRPMLSSEQLSTSQFHTSMHDLLAMLLLDIGENDTVLDMDCGGDAYSTILGLLLHPPEVTRTRAWVNDCSVTSRERRFNCVSKFVPDSVLTEQRFPVVFKSFDTADYEPNNPLHASFSKVLLDAPCINDRLAVLGDTTMENLFHPRNLKKLQELRNQQISLLSNALCACGPGGRVLYLLRSLCPPHSDSVVETTLHMHNTASTSKFSPIDLQPIFSAVNPAMCHQMGSCGIYIYPQLHSNFGPLYLSLLSCAESESETNTTAADS